MLPPDRLCVECNKNIVEDCDRCEACDICVACSEKEEEEEEKEKTFLEIQPNTGRQAVYAMVDEDDKLICVLDNCESADEMLAKNQGKDWTYILTELLSEAPGKDTRSGFRRDIFCRAHHKWEPYNVIRPEDEEEEEKINLKPIAAGSFGKVADPEPQEEVCPDCGKVHPPVVQFHDLLQHASTRSITPFFVAFIVQKHLEDLRKKEEEKEKELPPHA